MPWLKSLPQNLAKSNSEERTVRTNAVLFSFIENLTLPDAMKKFAALIDDLAGTTKTNDKLAALTSYFQSAPDEDKVWVIALFTGRRPKRLVNSTIMKEWCMEITGLKRWLFDEAYHTVGDLSEAIALLLPPLPDEAGDESLADMMLDLRNLRKATDDEKKNFVLAQWRNLPQGSCLVFNKLIMGGFRIGVSQNLIIKALAQYSKKDLQEVAHMLSGEWDPYVATFQELMDDSMSQADDSKPYPFYLAYPLEKGREELGAVVDWQVEWKWDGIRGQLIHRGGKRVSLEPRGGADNGAFSGNFGGCYSASAGHGN